ncbi:alanine/glycine:cation symporter family protein [Alteribacter natronophilus]|uniref:alanine/glycine:cation symporter family protein n=1 Tax=Alteribacter natronophilus TaxID=2583810 RepID=UPI00110E6203|nr:sodium:alanine symporter family protein [Alteribacter natronophilus]TMW72090.1 sodium:alanine symporter family protein [Alteribacter natronophilus]
MEALNDFIGAVSDIVWGVPLLVLLVGTGVFLTVRLAFLQFRTLPYALKLSFSPRAQDKKSKGDISHFQALTTALAATIGTGNIAGVATAVVLGGPGAVFWMWITALFGMATKYAEAILAVKYRVEGKDGKMAGGPMYYLEKGLNLKWLGIIFAVFGACAAFGIGNMVQSNTVADAMESTFSIPIWATGITLTVLAGLVILGGIKAIGRVTAYVVPFMALFYVIAGIVIIVQNFELVPAAVGFIFTDAFTGEAAAGGAIGAVIRWGVARGVFSNEAGLGSAPIAAAAARTDYPGRQALVSMTQVFIDTIVVCSITGVAIVMAGMYGDGLTGADLTTASFEFFLGGTGGIIVAVGVAFFAFSTILGWSYYGEKCFEYFAKPELVKFYRYFFVLAIFLGAIAELNLVWGVADVFNGLMAIPNLIALLGLSGVVVAETNRFLKVAKEEKQKARQAS